MSKQVILLMNLGSPDSPTRRDLIPYLNEFLMDEKVIDIPLLLRTILVKGIIVPFRSGKSAKKYETIWTDEGSPLIATTEKLAEKVATYSKLPTYTCMRYGTGSPLEELPKIVADHPDLEKVVLLPLYPHFAMSSYETAVEHVVKAYKQLQYKFQLDVVKPFYDHPEYISNLAESLKPYLNQPYDHILFSYHGIPVRHVKKTDPTGEHCFTCENCCDTPSEAHNTCYRHQVFTTTRMVAEQLQLPKDKFSVSFQSRLGTDKWLTPATTDVMKSLPGKGVKHLIVMSPAFVSDCLETLEELHEEERENFLEAGGEVCEVVPCLNLNDDWVATIDTLLSYTE